LNEGYTLKRERRKSKKEGENEERKWACGTEKLRSYEKGKLKTIQGRCH